MLVKTFIETAYELHEREILKKFHDGITHSMGKNPEHSVELDIGKSFSACDIAIIFGSWKAKERDHHAVKNSIVEFAPLFVVIETPLINRKVFEDNQYYRIGINGFLNHSGIFNYGTHNSDRLAKMNINWQGWKAQGNEILLFLQLPGDASLRGANIYHWAKFAVDEIRKRTNRPIKIRTHPKHTIKDTDEIYKLIADLSLNHTKDVVISFGKDTPLQEDLSKAFCTVTFTSGSAVDSIIQGVPTIACDPGNFAYDISSNYLEEIENPKRAPTNEVQHWLNQLSYSQWSVDEMYQGTAWGHLYPLITPILEAKYRKKK